MFRIALIAVLALVAAAGPCFPQAQAQAQAAAASGDVWPTTPGAPQPPSLNDRKAKAEDKGRELETKLKDDDELVRRYVRPGMGVAEVRELLGEPRGAAASVQSGQYLCLGYGRVWVVFEDGQVSCLRSRLEYVARYDSNCHCAGNAMNIVPFARP